MATDISALKGQIMTRISTNITTVQDVSPYEKTGFDGFPAVTVTCSGNENDYWSTAENQRQFTFIIRIYQQIDKKPTLEELGDNQKEVAEGIIERVVSQIIDTFDNFYSFNNAADFCRAVPSTWWYTKIGESWCRTAEIKLQVVKSFTIT